ncbi:hypothetical protein B0H17DRAFT_1338783, partial [Mycena rosella]
MSPGSYTEGPRALRRPPTRGGAAQMTQTRPTCCAAAPILESDPPPSVAHAASGACSAASSSSPRPHRFRARHCRLVAEAREQARLRRPAQALPPTDTPHFRSQRAAFVDQVTPPPFVSPMRSDVSQACAFSISVSRRVRRSASAPVSPPTQHAMIPSIYPDARSIRMPPLDALPRWSSGPAHLTTASSRRTAPRPYDHAPACRRNLRSIRAPSPALSQRPYCAVLQCATSDIIPIAAIVELGAGTKTRPTKRSHHRKQHRTVATACTIRAAQCKFHPVSSVPSSSGPGSARRAHLIESSPSEGVGSNDERLTSARWRQSRGNPEREERATRPGCRSASTRH